MTKTAAPSCGLFLRRTISGTESRACSDLLWPSFQCSLNCVKYARRVLGTRTRYFFPPTAARHLPYNSSRWVAYSSGFDAEPVPWKPTPDEVVRP